MRETGLRSSPAGGTAGGAKKPRLSPHAAGAARRGDASPLRLPAEVDGELRLLPEEEKTPSADKISTPHAPAAPTKSGSSFNRTNPSPAVRSLTPVFNGCTNAAERARQMGGQFVRLRRQASGGTAGGSPLTSGPKRSRSRSVLAELLLSPAEFLARRAPTQAAEGKPAAAGGKAAPAAAAVAAVPGGSPPSPAPTPLSLQAGPVTTFLLTAEAAVTAAVAAGEVQGAAAAKAAEPFQAALSKPAAAAAVAARRPAGRPVGHVEAQQQEAEDGQGWLRNAAFKLR